MADISWHTMQASEIMRNLGTNTDSGLSHVEAENRLKKYGYNQLEEKEGISPLMLFLGQFNDFIVWILIAATIVSGFWENGSMHWPFLPSLSSMPLLDLFRNIVPRNPLRHYEK